MKVDLFKKPAVILKNFVKLIFLSLIYVLFSVQVQAQSSLLSDSNSQNAFGVTPLMSAVIDQDISGVKFFARAQDDYLNKKNIGGASALHLAARVGNLEIVKLLVENGAQINIKDNEGWTPLMRSVITAKVEVISYLLSKEADATILNSSSESVIYHAASVSCSECLQELLSKYDFESKMTEETLKSQINISFELSRNKEDQKTQDILSSYLELIAKNKEIAAQKEKEEQEAKEAEKARIAAEEKEKKEAEEAARKAALEADEKSQKEKQYNFLKPELGAALIAQEQQDLNSSEEIGEEKTVTEQKAEENQSEIAKEEVEELATEKLNEVTKEKEVEKAALEADEKSQKEKLSSALIAQEEQQVLNSPEEVREEEIVTEQKAEENQSEIAKEEVEESVTEKLKEVTKEKEVEEVKKEELPEIPKAIDYKAQAHKKVKRFIILKGEDKKVDVRLDDKIEKVVILNENNEVINEVETKDMQDEVEVKKKKILFKFNKAKEDSENLVEIEETSIAKEDKLEDHVQKKKSFSLKKSEEEKPLQNEKQEEEKIIVEKQFENDEIFEEPELFINESDLVAVEEKVEEESMPKSNKIFRLSKETEESVKKQPEEAEKKSSREIMKKKFIFKKNKNYITPEKIEEDYNNNSDLEEEEEEISIKDDNYNSSNSSEKRYYFIPSR